MTFQNEKNKESGYLDSLRTYLFSDVNYSFP